MGRVPNATISLMYWNVRLESICGSGPVSAGPDSDTGEVVECCAGGVAAPFFAAGDGAEEDPLLHAILPSMNRRSPARDVNHEEYRGRRKKSPPFPPRPLFSNDMISPVVP